VFRVDRLTFPCTQGKVWRCAWYTNCFDLPAFLSIFSECSGWIGWHFPVLRVKSDDVPGTRTVLIFLLFFQYCVNSLGGSADIAWYSRRRLTICPGCERSYIGWLIVLYWLIDWFILIYIVLYYIYFIILLYRGGVVIHPNTGFRVQISICSHVSDPTAERITLPWSGADLYYLTQIKLS